MTGIVAAGLVVLAVCRTEPALAVAGRIALGRRRPAASLTHFTASHANLLSALSAVAILSHVSPLAGCERRLTGSRPLKLGTDVRTRGHVLCGDPRQRLSAKNGTNACGTPCSRRNSTARSRISR